MRMANLVPLVLAAALGFCWLSATPGVAQDFRIDTDIFVDDEKEPVFETLTIFTNGLVYDFLLTGVKEITLLDRDRDRLVLMDPERKIKTELTMETIIQFVAQMKSQMNEQQRKDVLSDTAEAVTDEDGWLKLGNERVIYRAECIKPKEKSTALEYQEFADWYARLNTMRGNLPPFLRIRLNSEIAKLGLIPKTVERTITDKKLLSKKTHTVRSRHLANWRLSNTDRKMLDRADTYLTSFPTVSFREYFHLHSVAVKENQRDRH